MNDVDCKQIEVECSRLGVVLAPDGSEYEVEGVLNPGVARDRVGRLLLFPRMVAAGNVSRIGIVRGVERAGGMEFERVGIALEPKTAYEARESQPGGHGCEDARVTYVPLLDRYLMTYTAFGPLGARIAVAVSHDAYAWERVGLLHFADDRWNSTDNKDAAFFPEPVRSPAGAWCYAVFHRPMLPETINGQTPISVILALPPERREATRIAYIPVDAVARSFDEICCPTEDALFLPVGSTWGKLKNGAGTPPVRIDAGWLSVFHAVDAIERDGRPALYYSAGIVIADAERPDRTLYRSNQPILVPETTSERFGTVNDVVFPTGLDPKGDGWDMYYGAADARISRAQLRLSFS